MFVLKSDFFNRWMRPNRRRFRVRTFLLLNCSQKPQSLLTYVLFKFVNEFFISLINCFFLHCRQQNSIFAARCLFVKLWWNSLNQFYPNHYMYRPRCTIWKFFEMSCSSVTLLYSLCSKVSMKLSLKIC